MDGTRTLLLPLRRGLVHKEDPTYYIGLAKRASPVHSSLP